MKVSREQVLRFRARASQLHERFPAGSYADAAYGGLTVVLAVLFRGE